MKFMFRGLFTCHVVSMMSVQGQTCEATRGLAAVVLDLSTNACQLDRSQCSLSTECGDCRLGPQGISYTSDCYDGCSYTTGGFTVERIAHASTGDGILIGFTHKFVEGAEGSIFYWYEAGIHHDSNDQMHLLQVPGGMCSYTFNGNQCLCEPRYCSDSSVANFIDCTQFQGGGVIDYCIGSPILTAESTLHQILHWEPFVACFPPVSLPSPTTPAPPVPNTAPTAAVQVPTEPGASPVNTLGAETPKPNEPSSLTSGVSASGHNNTFLAFITVVFGFGFFFY